MAPYTRTLSPLASPGQYPRRVGVRLDDVMARELGISPARAHRILYEYPRLLDMVRAAVVAYRAVEDPLGLVRLRAAVEAGAAGAERLTAALWLETEQADAAEEVTGLAYHLRPSRETAAAYVRSLDRQTQTASVLRAALVERWGL